MEGRRVKNSEKVNLLSSDFIGYRSSDFVLSEEMVECPNKIDKVMAESHNYAEATRCEDVRMEDVNKYKMRE